MNKKGSINIALIILVVLLIVGAIWYYEANKESAFQMSLSHDTITTTSIQTTAASSTVPPSTSWLASIKRTSPEVVPVPSSVLISEKIRGKFAFIQGGDVWVADQDGNSQLQLTHAGSEGEVRDFTFSPNFQYLEYHIPWFGAYARGTINILDLNTNKVVFQVNGLTLYQFGTFKSMLGSQTPYVAFDSWINNNQFIYDAWGLDGPGGGANEYGKLLVDLQNGTTTVIQPQ